MKSTFTPLFFLLLLLSTAYHLKGQSILVEVDSLWSLYHQQTDEQKKIDRLNDISYAYRRLSPDSVMKYAEQALERSGKINYTIGLAYAYKNKGIANYKLGAEPDTTIQCYQKALFYANEAQDYYTQAACYNNIALIHIYNLSYNEAIQSLLKGIDIFDRHIPQDNRLKALILGNLGTAFRAQEENERSITYFEQALALAARINDRTIPSMYIDELAMTKMDMGRIEEAYYDVLNILPLTEKLGDLESKASTMITLAEIECQLHKYLAAKDHAMAALDIAIKQNFTRKRIQSLTILSTAYSETGNFTEAIAYAQQALGISQKTEMYLYEAKILSLLSNLYYLTQDHKSALYYLQQYNQVYDRNRHRENKELAARLEADYQAREAQNQIDLLQKEQLAQKNRIRLLWFVSLFFLILLFIGGYIYFLRWRTSRELNEKNNALAKAEQKLYEKNQQLQAYIESNLQLESFAYLASHDLREPMRTIVSFSQLLQKSAVRKLDQNELEYLHFIQEGTRRIETLINDLLTYAKINNTPAVIEKVDLNNTIHQVCQDLQRLIREKKAAINIHLLPQNMLSDPARMYQLFQNLISNAIKYSKDGEPPIIRIHYQMQEKFHHFSITDNGIGIAPEFHDRIFLLFKTLKNKSISNSSGIGLATCKKIVEQMGGRIWLESIEDVGSTFHFTLPVQPEQDAIVVTPSLQEEAA